MQKLSLIIFFSIFSLFFILSANAQEAPSVQTIIQEETIATEDLEVKEPTLLPSSPFYFVKEWTRGIRKAFTFNPVKKVQLEVRFADERIVEAKRLAAQAPQQTQAIEKALQNYRRSQARIKTELALIEETSKNPEVDKLLEKLTDRGIKHEKLLAQLKDKFEEKAELKTTFDAVKEGLEESIAEVAKKDEAEKFAKRIEKALVEAKGSDLKHVRSLEILDRVSQRAPEEFKEKLAKVREEFSQRLKEDIEAFVEKHEEKGAELVKETLEMLPGEKARRIIIIEEIQTRAEKRVGEALKETGEVLEKVVQEREEFEERVKEAIEHAKELIAKLDERINKFVSRELEINKFVSRELEIKERENIPAAVTRLAREANLHLERAISAFAEKKFGEAFGLAHSAEVLARNAMRLFEEVKPEGEELKKEINKAEEGIRTWDERIASIAPELQPKLKEILEEVRFHLRLAGENFEKGALREAKKHLEEAKAAWRKLERLFHELKREGRVEKTPVSAAPREEEVTPTPAEKREVVCTQEYEPVCGADRKTYPNECHAKAAGIGIMYKGVCEERKPEVTETPKPTTPLKPEVKKEPEPTEKPEQIPSTQIITELKVEADDKGFYPTNTLTVEKSAKVKLTFFVRSEGVYYGGLDFRSEKFTTPSVKPGGVTSVEFTADNSFTITSYWPASGVKKADLKIEVK